MDLVTVHHHYKDIIGPRAVNIICSSPLLQVRTHDTCECGESEKRGKEREEGNERPPVLVVSHGLDAFPHDKNQRIQLCIEFTAALVSDHKGRF